jgi:hypothetical protein
MIIAPSREDIKVLGKAPTFRAVSDITNIESVTSIKDEPNIRSGKFASILALVRNEKNNKEETIGGNILQQ